MDMLRSRLRKLCLPYQVFFIQCVFLRNTFTSNRGFRCTFARSPPLRRLFLPARADHQSVKVDRISGDTRVVADDTGVPLVHCQRGHWALPSRTRKSAASGTQWRILLRGWWRQRAAGGGSVGLPGLCGGTTEWNEAACLRRLQCALELLGKSSCS